MQSVGRATLLFWRLKGTIRFLASQLLVAARVLGLWYSSSFQARSGSSGPPPAAIALVVTLPNPSFPLKDSMVLLGTSEQGLYTLG